jgi:SAM-dependent methyltransferase
LKPKQVDSDHPNTDITLIQSEQSFYDSRWCTLEVSETERQRIAVTVASIPSDCRSILDIGCGDGRLSTEMSLSKKVVAYDLSTVALRRFPFRGLKCCGSAHQLPFRDRSFDSVLSTEMLEHLPPTFYSLVLEEIARVADQYILITVPNSENLEENIVQCTSCGSRFHLWAHQRSYSPAAVRTLFAGFVPVRLFPFGPPTTTYNRFLLWIRTRIAGTCAWAESCVCHSCGATVMPSSRFPFLGRCCDFLNQRLWAPYTKRISWLLALYERQGL